VAQKHPESSDGGQLQLVQGQKHGSRPTDVEGNYMAALCPHEDDDTVLI